MEETIEKIKKNYEENLAPQDYNKTLGRAFQEMEEMFVTFFTALHKLVNSGRFKGNKLLEIGSGATVHNIASASAYFSEIVQSDFVEANCEELRKWLRGESQLDWTEFLKAVAKIEGIDDSDSGVQEIENRIRKSVKSVVRCDIMSDEVVPREVATEYDLIITSFTLECAALDIENFVTILKRLNRLLRPGAGLVMIGFINHEEWTTDGGSFRYLKVTQEDVDKALDEAGFNKREWIVVPKVKGEAMFEYDAYYYVTSTKT